MKIISWNVAGFRAALKKGFIDFFEKSDADIFCLQEVKAEKNQIEFDAENYYEYLNPAERKGYSGTLIYTKKKPLNISYGLDGFLPDNEGRVITLEFDNFYLITIYTPNVKRDLSRLSYRMIWEEQFLKYIKNLETTKPVVICGDLNVAHNEIDLKNAKANIGNAGFTYEEREKFSNLLNNGLIDTFRYLYPDTIKYSWWSYMGFARENNIGWRIDYFLISERIKNKLKDAYIYDDIYGSDHCPIGIEIDL
ncbi:MAG: exodeoxyribonuclease III [Mollicutes bacterium]|mgnify:CR=1 FL=1|nr:exodeoxyribonuclease III [Mollicutes bacterium]